MCNPPVRSIQNEEVVNSSERTSQVEAIDVKPVKTGVHIVLGRSPDLFLKYLKNILLMRRMLATNHI